jgi:integrase
MQHLLAMIRASRFIDRFVPGLLTSHLGYKSATHCAYHHALKVQEPSAEAAASPRRRARFGFPVHAHMLRHACGYALANAGHDIQDGTPS